MYNRALPGYTAVQGPSSKWCMELKDRLRKLQSSSAKPSKDQVKSSEIEVPKSRSLGRIFRKIGNRLGAR
jgi:hypothetical protein